jgi:ATP-dependent exoDNAse (exonuclease V) beta subunit
MAAEPERLPPDAAAREAALDPTRSFIVQAPAGSGKTTLLTQRYLALLARAERPEEVLAITFTRKAAAEMRQRILDALLRAARDEPVRGASEERARVLAQAVLARSEASGWSLLDHPSRLKIQTIDALNQWLAQRLPLLSRAGSAPAVHERPRELYDEAAARVLAALEEGGALAERLAAVLVHLDNDLAYLQRLLAEMLGKRDHWLRLVAPGAGARGPEVRAALEASLGACVADALARVRGRFPRAYQDELVHLCRDAGRRLASGDGGAAWECLGALRALPPAEPGALAAWQRIAELLLTADGTWRRQVNKNQGFPAHEKQAKQSMMALLAALGEVAGLADALDRTRRLPPPAYDDEQWEVLDALIDVLVAAAAELELVFARHGRVDFVAVAGAARQALGDDDEPTELALVLDYRIRHLLVDEFQDTSVGQVELLRRLTAGWQPGDGRTLFCVGDPMQSIYRFREADVALFLKIRDEGLGELRPESLVLEANFRSCPGIVRWVNEAFERVLPAADDLERGAVRYSSSFAMRPEEPGPALVVHGLPRAAPALEAARIADLVSAERARDPQASIVVLGRARTHLVGCAQALARAGLRYQGIDLVPLADRLAVRDLVSLARALSHPADRAAWLACLRAPWCGLDLPALHALFGDEPRGIVLDAVRDPGRRARLAGGDRARLERTLGVLEAALAERGRRSLAGVVEAAWLELGGPATLADDADLDNVRAFLERLDRAERAGDLDDPAALEDLIADLFAAPDAAADERLQVMTVHRAKGLEWDVVIVAGLGRATTGEQSQLLRWLELERAGSAPGLVLAPLKARSVRADPLETWLKRLDGERADHELGRLLYVATTRARRRLHLVAHVEPVDADAAAPEFRRPRRRTALATLWPTLGPDVLASAQEAAGAGQGLGTPAAPAGSPALLRLADDWQAPPAAPRLPSGGTGGAGALPEVEFEWVTAAGRHAGTVVHEELERLATLAPGQPPEEIASRAPAWRRRLRELGLPPDQVEGVVGRIGRALATTLADARGRWLFDPAHGDARSEYALTAVLDGEVVAAVIDRTFVDADGVRWIVDFKTAAHEGGDREAFLDREKLRHAPQLERYARIFSLVEPGRAVRLGLYFPLLGAWREWAPAGDVPVRTSR